MFYIIAVFNILINIYWYSCYETHSFTNREVTANSSDENYIDYVNIWKYQHFYKPEGEHV